MRRPQGLPRRSAEALIDVRILAPASSVSAPDACCWAAGGSPVAARGRQQLDNSKLAPRAVTQPCSLLALARGLAGRDKQPHPYQQWRAQRCWRTGGPELVCGRSANTARCRRTNAVASAIQWPTPRGVVGRTRWPRPSSGLRGPRSQPPTRRSRPGHRWPAPAALRPAGLPPAGTRRSVRRWPWSIRTCLCRRPGPSSASPCETSDWCPGFLIGLAWLSWLSAVGGRGERCGHPRWRRGASRCRAG
jgi:hypothetical protein